MNFRTTSWFFLLSWLAATNALAHPRSDSSIIEGLIHPLHGLDHLLTALAVGLLSAQKYKFEAVTPLTFISGMLIGSGFGLWQLSLPFIEYGIFFSVVLMGGVLFIPFKPSMKMIIPCMLVFGFLHGNAHSFERHLTSSGFVISTILLHGVGFFVVKSFQHFLGKQYASKIVSLSGVGIAGIAIFLFFR
jgi:urease accessory protein